MLPPTTIACSNPTDYPLKGLTLPLHQPLDKFERRRDREERHGACWTAAGKRSNSRSLVPFAASVASVWEVRSLRHGKPSFQIFAFDEATGVGIQFVRRNA